MLASSWKKTVITYIYLLLFLFTNFICIKIIQILIVNTKILILLIDKLIVQFIDFHLIKDSNIDIYYICMYVFIVIHKIKSSINTFMI